MSRLNHSHPIRLSSAQGLSIRSLVFPSYSYAYCAMDVNAMHSMTMTIKSFSIEPHLTFQTSQKPYSTYMVHSMRCIWAVVCVLRSYVCSHNNYYLTDFLSFFVKDSIEMVVSEWANDKHV